MCLPLNSMTSMKMSMMYGALSSTDLLDGGGHLLEVVGEVGAGEDLVERRVGVAAAPPSSSSMSCWKIASLEPKWW